MTEFNRVAVKMDREQASAVEAVLREAGMVEMADKFLAKFTEKETGPRLVKVRSIEDRKNIIQVESMRVDAKDLEIGDEVVLAWSRYAVKEIEGDVVTCHRTTPTGQVNEKRVIQDKFTKLLDEHQVVVEEKAPEAVEEKPAKAKKEKVVEQLDPKRKIKGETAKDRKNRMAREKRAAAKVA